MMNRQFSTKIINFGFHQVELSELRPAMTSLGYETKNDTIFTMYDHLLKVLCRKKIDLTAQACQLLCRNQQKTG